MLGLLDNRCQLFDCLSPTAKRSLSSGYDDCENKTQSPIDAEQLLKDVYDCFIEFGQVKDDGKLHSDEIISHLIELEEAPWKTFQRGQVLDKSRMAKLLKGFDVHTQQMKRMGKNKRGMNFCQIKLAVET